MTGQEQEVQTDDGQAICKILEVLQPLNDTGRDRVLAAVRAYFARTPPPMGAQQQATTPSQGPQGELTQGAGAIAPTPARDIRAFRQQKQPKTDIEMAAVTAYYLQELAPDKQDSVSAEDIEKYFKQAGHRLPKVPRQTLPNAKNAGYFDSVGEGRYKLNPVGYNLVAHTLPRSAGQDKAQGTRKKPTGTRKGAN